MVGIVMGWVHKTQFSTAQWQLQQCTVGTQLRQTVACYWGLQLISCNSSLLSTVCIMCIVV